MLIHSAAARPHAGSIPALRSGLQSNGLMPPVRQVLRGRMAPAARPVPLAGAHHVLVEAGRCRSQCVRCDVRASPVLLASDIDMLMKGALSRQAASLIEHYAARMIVKRGMVGKNTAC